MDATGGECDVERERAVLIARLDALRAIAAGMTVMSGTIAAVDHERASAELEAAALMFKRIEALAERGAEFLGPMADRLHGIGIVLESALYMGGVNGTGGQSVYELKQALEAILDRSSQ